MDRPRPSAICVLLLLGAAVNLAAGARRPFVERALHRTGRYAVADRAEAAVRAALPPSARLGLVVYAGDTVENVDHAFWFDYQMKWRLYPRRLPVFVIGPDGRMRRRVRYPPARVTEGPPETPAGELFLLLCRMRRPPDPADLPPTGRRTTLARGEGFVLVRWSRR